MSIDVFISYSPADAEARRILETHLSALQRSRLIRTWAEHQIGPGQEWRAAVDKRLEEAHLIVLLISPDFLASNYCYDVEMKRALERHRAGVARVVPIIVRHVDWRGTPVEGLWMLPESARPVSSTGWGTSDKAWTNVALGLRGVVEEMMGGVPSHSPPSGRSFVEARGSYASTPPPYSAPSFVAPSSARPSLRSRPTMASPVNAYHPPRARRRSPFLFVLATLIVAAAGGAAGFWALQTTTADSATANLRSTATVAPPLPAPRPSPTPTPTIKSDPPPVPPSSPAPVAGPCCGGSDCASGRQDTRESSCAKLPGKCAICPSLRTIVEGACRDPIEPSTRVLLRLARLNLPGTTPAPTHVCVRVEGDPAGGRQCTLATEASDAHPGGLGSERSTRLPVAIADLIETGRGLDIDVEIAGRLYASKPGLILKGDLLRSALCQGISYSVGDARVFFYLDDP